MLDAVGAKSFDDLFADIAAEYQTESFQIPGGRSELEVLQSLRRLAARNSGRLVNFCGAGFYDHFIPAAVDALAGRGEFFTAYTPYQPEAAQGTLQAIFEYQTYVCELTGMDASNASVYDGATAAAESMFMLRDAKRKKKIFYSAALLPDVKRVMKTYARFSGITLEEIPCGADGRTGAGGRCR